MTNLEYLAQALEMVLGIFLIIKLLTLKLHSIYKLFSLFLVAELLGSSVWLVQRFFDINGVYLDYRLLWVGERAMACTLILLTVYTLLGTVLQTLPGVLTLSRRILNTTFALAALIGIVSVAREYHQADYAYHSSWQDGILLAGILADRLISGVVLISIVSILCFLLWFPVQIARNLAVFIVGFSAYAAGSSFSLLFQRLIVHDRSRWISTSIELLTSACFAYWSIFISPAGEHVPAHLYVRRDPEEQDRLIRSLELLNNSVLRGSR